MNSRSHDIAIIGAGPGGLAAWQAARQANPDSRILMIERGRDLKHRVCPVDRGRNCRGCAGTCNVLSGLGGCIHYGDGVKLSQFPAGRRLETILGPLAHDRMQDAVAIFEYHLGERCEWTVPHADDESPEGFKPYPVATVNSRGVRRVLESFRRELAADSCADWRFNTAVTHIHPLRQGFKLVLKGPGGEESIHAEQVIVATGRSGLRWWRQTLRELGLSFEYPQPSVGLRFEMNARWLRPAACVHPDYKVTMREPVGKFKSFCYCAGATGGQLKYTDYGDFCLLDGHVSAENDALDLRGAAANFALLYQLSDVPAGQDPFPWLLSRYVEPYRSLRRDTPGKPIAQTLSDFIARRSSSETWPELRARLHHVPTVQDLAPARIDTLFDDALHQGFCQSLDRYLRAVLGYGEPMGAHERDNILVVALELEGLWDTVHTDMDMESSHAGLFVVGDAMGAAQGILSAMASGVAAARAAVARVGRARSQTVRDRIVYDRYWTTGDYLEPSETLARMVEALSASARGEHRTPRVADLGCGIGRHALHAASRGAHVIAVDHSHRAVERLRACKADLPIEVIEGDFVQWIDDANAESMDGIVCFDALHHVTPDAEMIKRTLQRLQRLLRPKGYVLVTLLADIDYGVSGPPPGRLLLDTEAAAGLLDEALAERGTLLASKQTPVRFEQTVDLDGTSAHMVRTHYAANRVLRLYQMSN